MIAHFNHARQFADFFPELVATGLPIIIVDDGSDAENFAAVNILAHENFGVYLFQHKTNRGKGAAVKTGFAHARCLGFSHVIQIDADGQHCAKDVCKFIERSRRHPSAIICGKPIFDQSAFKARRYGRKVTTFWMALETLSFKIKDGLCGFRLYPLLEIEDLLDHSFVGSRMEFDPGILVKSVWRDISIEFIPTNVVYQKEGVSHFDYLRDNLSFFQLHTRLMLGMVLHAPKLILRRFGMTKSRSLQSSNEGNSSEI